MKFITAFFIFSALLPLIAKAETVSKPSITAISSAGKTITFTAKLNSKLPFGYKVKIDSGNGKGLVSMSCSVATCSLSSNQFPLGSSSGIYKIGIYNAQNILQGTTTNGTYIISNSPPTLTFIDGKSISAAGASYTAHLKASDNDSNLNYITIQWGDGASDSKNTTNNTPVSFSHIYTSIGVFTWTATAYDQTNSPSSSFSTTLTISPPNPVIYTKISNSGNTLPDSAVLGSGINDWACTKDNKTGLVWEVKTTSELRETIKTYTYPMAVDFENAVNKLNYCGITDWRLPTKTELTTLVSQRGDPYINTAYFPNTQSAFYWTSSDSDLNPTKKYTVNFGNPPPALTPDNYSKDHFFSVRLVH